MQKYEIICFRYACNTQIYAVNMYIYTHICNRYAFFIQTACQDMGCMHTNTSWIQKYACHMLLYAKYMHPYASNYMCMLYAEICQCAYCMQKYGLCMQNVHYICHIYAPYIFTDMHPSNINIHLYASLCKYMQVIYAKISDYTEMQNQICKMQIYAMYMQIYAVHMHYAICWICKYMLYICHKYVHYAICWICKYMQTHAFSICKYMHFICIICTGPSRQPVNFPNRKC